MFTLPSPQSTSASDAIQARRWIGAECETTNGSPELDVALKRAVTREMKLSNEINLKAAASFSEKPDAILGHVASRGDRYPRSFTFPTGRTRLSIGVAGQEGTTESYLRENELRWPRRGQFELRRPAIAL